VYYTYILLNNSNHYLQYESIIIMNEILIHIGIKIHSNNILNNIHLWEFKYYDSVI